jgi:hypothetical protein
MSRPLKFKSPEEILKKANAYFNECIETSSPITITGLALALDTSRETLINYEKREEFFDTIKKCKLVCENYAEKQLYEKGGSGPIFALKNFGWKDKTETDINVNKLDDILDKIESGRD